MKAKMLVMMKGLMMLVLCQILMTTASNAQDLKEISAKVVDSTGQPIKGADVHDATNRYKAVTDANGWVSLSVPSDYIEVTITLIGYQSQKYTLKTGGEQVIVLAPVPGTDLNEVVVVGYGTQKKVNLTGAIATVGSKELANRPVTSVGNALQGTMSGVTVTAAASGQPGRDAATIRVRGIGTLNNANAMVLVDGVISTMNNVNPDDVESISVLKDAASAAIYGSRAANGVILITTKKGKKGTSQVAYSAYVGKQKANGLPDFLSSWQSATLYNQSQLNEGKAARYTDAEIQKFKDGSDPYNYANTDWLGLAYQGNGAQQNHYLSVSGGTDKGQYLFSLGYYDQNGLVKKTNSKRYTARLNLSSVISDKLTVTGNLAYTYSPLEEPQSSYPGVPSFTQIIRQINRLAPMVPYKYANGNYGYAADGSPMAWLESPSFNHENYHDLVGNATADWTPIKGLHFKPSLFYVLKMANTKTFIADIQYYNVQGDATLYQGPNSVTDGNSTNYVVTQQDLLEYTRAVGLHYFKLLAGYSQEYTRYSYDQGYRKNLLNNELSDLNLGSTDGQTSSGYTYESALQSYFGRFNYDFEGKYLFEANLRRDGSSRFSSVNRWGTFPSFSAGWNIDREAFFAPLKNIFSNLKLRGSWGKLGNQTLSSSLTTDMQYYPSITLVNTGNNYTFGGTSPVIASGIAPVNGANENIKWETTTETSVGIDAGFMNSRLTLTADYFHKMTDGILINVPIGSVYGLTAPVQNAGSVMNKGWEITIGYNDHKGDFTYNGSLNMSFISNDVTDLHGTGPIISGYTFQQVGYPINALYGYQADGIFQSADEVASHAKQSSRTAAGDIKYKDQNGDGVINSADKVYLGNLYPKTTFGLNLGASYKGVDLVVFFQGAANVKAYYDAGKIGSVSASTGKPTSALLDTWTLSNTSAQLPRIWSAYTQNDPAITPSSFWVKNGSYLRLKNLQILIV